MLFFHKRLNRTKFLKVHENQKISNSHFGVIVFSLQSHQQQFGYYFISINIGTRNFLNFVWDGPKQFCIVKVLFRYLIIFDWNENPEALKIIREKKKQCTLKLRVETKTCRESAGSTGVSTIVNRRGQRRFCSPFTCTI